MRNGIGSVGRVSEKHTARRLGARQTAASGAGGEKGDMTVDDWRIEAKSTQRKSLAIQHDWLAGIGEQARLSGCTPALAVTFTHADGRPAPDGSWVMIPEHVFRDLLGGEDS